MKKIDISVTKEEAELFVGKVGRWDTYTLRLDNEEILEVNHCFIDGSFEDISVQSIWGGGTLNRTSEIMPLLEEMGELVAHHPSSIMEFIEDSDTPLYEDYDRVLKEVKQASFDLDIQLA